MQSPRNLASRSGRSSNHPLCTRPSPLPTRKYVIPTQLSSLVTLFSCHVNHRHGNFCSARVPATHIDGFLFGTPSPTQLLDYIGRHSQKYSFWELRSTFDYCYKTCWTVKCRAQRLLRYGISNRHPSVQPLFPRGFRHPTPNFCPYWIDRGNQISSIRKFRAHLTAWDTRFGTGDVSSLS